MKVAFALKERKKEKSFKLLASSSKKRIETDKQELSFHRSKLSSATTKKLYIYCFINLSGDATFP